LIRGVLALVVLPNLPIQEPTGEVQLPQLFLSRRDDYLKVLYGKAQPYYGLLAVPRRYIADHSVKGLQFVLGVL